jgi:hypothetical protein
LSADEPHDTSQDESIMTKVTVVIGAGSIGQAIAQRVSAGKHVLLADLKKENGWRCDCRVLVR